MAPAEPQNGGPAPGDRVRVMQFFIYPVPVAVLTTGDTVTSIVRIESATDFIWFKTTYNTEDEPPVSLDASTRILPLVDVQVQVSGADRNLFNNPVPVENMAGTGELPFVLPAPMILLANSEVRFDFTSRDPDDINLRLALIGLKDYGEMQRAPARV